MNDLIIDLNFTVEQLEKMLGNAKAGGLVQIKVKVDIQAEGKVDEVVLR